MNNVVPIHRDAHREALTLLPWYVSDALSEEDRAAVEAHLKDCADCRAELDFERRLAAEVVALPAETEPAWEAMQRKMDAPARRQAKPRRRATLRAAKEALPWLGWAVAAQILLLLGMRTLAPTPRPSAPATYHALASASASSSANIAVIFRPRTTESDIQAVLRSSGAHVVDGPTAADAWMLAAPAVKRDAALRSLRASPAVMTAEPVDPAGP
jgi:predicted anti-sigma-YlaC factor YlaD